MDESDSPLPSGPNISPYDSSYQPSDGGGSAQLECCGDFNLRIGRDGTWYYRGSPIGRKPLVKLFSSVLQRDQAGDYWLITPAERGRILVDDAPFVAVELDVSGTGPDQVLSLRTNVDDWVQVDEAHPLRVAEHPETGEPSPYVLVRDRLEALILRSVFYQLVAGAEERHHAGKTTLGVWSKGRFFPLGSLT